MRTHRFSKRERNWFIMNFFQIGISFIIFSLLFTGNQAATNNAAENEETFFEDGTIPSITDFRLPTTVIPISYEIMLNPELEKTMTFDGIVHIRSTVRNATKVITLHVGSVVINKVSVTTFINPQDEPRELDISTIKNSSSTEKYEITLKEILPVQTNISINFEYSGKLRDDMIGFYKSSYYDSSGTIRWLAATQFQTTHARHAFPCFDEPSFKATFTVRILRGPQYTSLSNMPLKASNKTNEGLYWDEFEHSIPMSTYLVAFVVSNFGNSSEGKVRVWARPNAIDQVAYALSITPRALAHLSTWFNQSYQLPKLDMVAVPDFSAGAMENWGLITYRESRLLYEEKTTSKATRQSIAAVIVHELTHMWFGNQITPEWWSYLWLSEAFARYFQYFATAQIEISWNMEEQFVVEQHQTALAADGIETSQPMTRNVSNSAQMSGIGDTIIYNKGGSIVRMMNLILGEKVFQTGLQNYLRDNTERKVARPENLFEGLQKAINYYKTPLTVPIKDIMSTWTTQAGFPVLLASIENGVVTMRQQRFLLRNLQFTPINVTWWVPISWASKSRPDFTTVNVTHWLSKNEGTINLGIPNEWVILNVQSAGFYRVVYDNASWYRIFDVLNSKNYQDIHVLNRAALVDDLLNLARAGLILYKTAFDGLQYIRQEKHYLPFKSALSGLTYLDQRFNGQPEYDLLKKFVLTLIQERYDEIGYEDKVTDDSLTVLLRAELNKWACNYGHQGCIITFLNMFQQWRDNHTLAIGPNQMAVAYCTGIRYGTRDDWEFLWNRYFNSNFVNEQMIILQALGCTRNATLLDRYLLYALESFEKSRIRKQDSSAVFSAVYNTGAPGAEFVLDFVAKYYNRMSTYYSGTGSIASILSSASQRFSTERLVEKFENMTKTQTGIKDISESLKTPLNVAKFELKWWNNFKGPIVSWITDFLDKNEDKSNYYLPRNIVPKAYLVQLTPHINETLNFTFDGTVKITAQVASLTKSIVLHSAEMHIRNVVVFKKEVRLETENISTTPKYDFLTIEMQKLLSPGDIITIEIDYVGNLNEEMRGFYRSWYKDSDDEVRWLAATHLEPVGARKVFPCFDEPALKATFTIEVTVQPGYGAISNMPIRSTTRFTNGVKKITFQETPLMSTYLVAVVVSDFTLLNQLGIYGVLTRSDAKSEGVYALSVMEPVLSFYENALNISYQLPKLDMVALPDFASGAMENWGLLTYKERNLLYSSRKSTTASKQAITNVIAHEIAHQWFGDLVSPRWWKYLWLNEGFARYFQYFATNTVMTDWSLETQFVVDQVHSAFEVDSSESSHPMTHDVYSPTQIRAIFDSISYNKGASVLRMLEKTVGHEVFYRALESYLKKREYNDATPEDLFDAFEEQINDTETRNIIHNVMSSWTTQAGYPIVHVNVQNNYLHLRQERFQMKQEKNNSTSSVWYIPITWTSLNDSNFYNTTPKYWFKDRESSIKIPSSDNDLLILNVQQAGFYRTNYDTKTWGQIINFLKEDSYVRIPEINRAALIDDLMNFARAGYVNYSIVLSATEYLEKEKDYAPWRAFFNGLTYLRRHVEGADAYDAFQRYVTTILKPVYNWYQFHDQLYNDHVTKIFRTYLNKWACDLQMSECESKVMQYLPFGNDSVINEAGIPPNQRSTVYCTIVKLTPDIQWKYLREAYSTTPFALTKAVILQSLACTTNKDLLTELLTSAITKDFDIRSEDSSGVFTSVISASLEGVETVMEFIKNNYDKMVTYYGGVSQVKSIVSALSKRLSTDELYEKYMNLIDWLNGKDSTLRSSLESYKTSAKEELMWAEKYIPQIHEWIERTYNNNNYRLPHLFSPLKYNVSLSPFFEERNFTFDGRVQIHLKRLQGPVSRIVLHAHELDIKSISVYDSDVNLTQGEKLNISSYFTRNDTQMLMIFMKNFIRSNYILVDIEFAGILNDNLQGFYRSYYSNEAGNIRWLATTQFEPTHARRAFPCLDEPAFKANFTIHIERPNDYIALSNMPSVKMSPSNSLDRTWVTFAETVQMSPYLVAFVVCDFKTVRNTVSELNVWGRPAIAPNGELAELAGSRMLKLLATETGHEYTLPKLDLIGIPDFSMGAMENWGLATFREYGLFYDKTVTSAKYTDYILTIIAHELAHMWFGNLVTCDWWEYIWLNEGFAEYMQWRVSHSFRPSHGFDDLFVVDELQVAMQSDDYVSSHPMNNPVASPSEIEQVFDTITYGKSSSVIRMIHNSLDPEIFPKAIHKYLLENQYKSATPKELWKAFDDVINEVNGLGNWNISMEELMDNWTNKAGYPVITVILQNQILNLYQSRFSFKYRTDLRNVLFYVPITMVTASKLDFTTTSTNIWMTKSEMDIFVDNPNEWILLNVRQSGYYRVNYDLKLWRRLFNALKEKNHSSIHVTNRAQIVDDLLNLARASQVNYSTVIEGLSYLIDEEEYLPWKAFFNGMNYIAQRYEGHKSQAQLGSYILYLTSKRFEKLGFKDSINNSHQDELSRELILNWVCKYNGTQCVSTSKKLFADWRRNVTKVISPNARSAVYCTALKYGSKDDWSFLWNRYLKTDFASEKKIILDALGCTKNKDLLIQYIEYAFTRNYTSSIRKQDVSAALASVYNSGQFGLETMLDYLITNYIIVYDYYGDWQSVGQLFLKVTSRFSTTEQYNKYKQFLGARKDELQSIMSTLLKGLETAEDNFDWTYRHKDNIDASLKRFMKNKQTNAGVPMSSLSITFVTIFSVVVYALS